MGTLLPPSGSAPPDKVALRTGISYRLALLKYHSRFLRGVVSPNYLYSCSLGDTTLGLATLVDPANIQSGETDLEKNECVGSIVKCPDDPQDVAEKEQPESFIALPLPLGGDHPGGYDCHYHCRPLDQIHPIHRLISREPSLMLPKFHARASVSAYPFRRYRPV